MSWYSRINAASAAEYLGVVSLGGESGSVLLGSCTTFIVVILMCASKGGYLNEALDDLGTAAALSNAQSLKGFPRLARKIN